MPRPKKKEGLFDKQGDISFIDAAEQFRQFAGTRDVKVVLYALSSLLTIPDTFKKANEFETICAVMKYEGEKALLDKFANLVSDVFGGHLEALEVLKKR